MEIYSNNLPIKAILIFEFLIGGALLYLSYFLVTNHIYLDVWVFALPLLALSLLIGSFRNRPVKSIEINNLENCLVIEKEGILKTETIFIDFSDLSFKLKKGNERFIHLVKKMRLEILENDNVKIELNSNLLGLNNKKIRSCYNHLNTHQMPE